MEKVNLSEIPIDIPSIESLFAEWDKQNYEFQSYSKAALNFLNNDFQDIKSQGHLDLDATVIRAIDEIIPVEDIRQEVYEGRLDDMQEYAKSIGDRIKKFLVELCDGKHDDIEIPIKGILHVIGDQILHRLGIPRQITIIYMVILVEEGYSKGKVTLCDSLSNYR